ncbi:MAG: hypothetical protein A2958_02460 [Candidatus Levybacteria bacterium RIFCSPLOWO2_01_FULL_38_13]|nr:MAG: hypothetical protein A2958_02460 [Candidatus Levybacteria bacterium RIFCSPLOWO2_01_FULL_38_13]
MKNIIVNSKIRFGKPIIAGTRLTVEEVLGALAGGMEFKEIQEEYGLTKQQILAAIRYVTGWIKGETTNEISPRR